MSIPGGIRAKLMLALVAIIGGALAGAYLIVVPSLEQRLVEAKLDVLERDANSMAGAIVANDLTRDPNTLAGLGAAFGARVVLYDVVGSELSVAFDTGGTEGSALLAEDPVALAARQNTSARGTVSRNSTRHAEAAVSLVTGEVLMLSANLSDQLATVELVKRRLLLASVVAMGFALALGAIAAGAHAARIRRLERAALRIAGGHFDEPIVDLADDELAELAGAFDEMRVQLRQLDTARKEFVANASHELRTPLFSLAGYLELLTDEDVDDETRAGFLRATREQVERLTRTATALLDLSRLDAGGLRLALDEVDLQDVATGLVEELTPLADIAGRRLEVIAGEHVWALADEERVVQIGRALVANALTHTPTGTHVRVFAREAGRDAELHVVDDGPGVPPEQVERIFDRFYRVEGVRASGSGLGLAIARELAARMGGSLTVESRPGHTAFIVRLPQSPGEAQTGAPRHRVALGSPN